MRCPIVSRFSPRGEIQAANFGVDFRESFCYDIPQIRAVDNMVRPQYNTLYSDP